MEFLRSMLSFTPYVSYFGAGDLAWSPSIFIGLPIGLPVDMEERIGTLT